MNQLRRVTSTDEKQVTNKTSASAWADDRRPQVRPNGRFPAGRAFPYVSQGQTVNARYLPRTPEVVIVEKKVMDTQLKHVLAVFGVFLVVAFIVGLILWGIS